MSGQTRYCYRPGTRVSGVSADAAGRELGRIVDEHGKVTAELVVAESVPPDSPCHPAFEWDDGVAAHEYRLVQARHLIRAVLVVPAKGEAEPAPAFARVVRGDESQYQPVAVIVRDEDLYRSALQNLIGCLRAAEKAVRQLQDAADQSGATAWVADAGRIRKPLQEAMDAANQAAGV